MQGRDLLLHVKTTVELTLVCLIVVVVFRSRLSGDLVVSYQCTLIRDEQRLGTCLFRLRSLLYAFYVFLCMIVAAAWWFGNISVSATTTFSLLPAVKTMTSATSSGVSGSQPAYTASALLLSP